MDENPIRITPFAGEKEKWCMWSGEFMARSVIKGYDVLLTGDKKILADDTDETKVTRNSESKLRNNKAYNELIIAHEDTVCFQSLKKKR